MYGNTRAIAQQLAKQLSKRGVTDIKIYDVSKTNASYIIADAWKYTNLVTIAPTYNLNLYLTMENFIHELKALNFQNHKVSIIGNHSWASAAMKIMVSHFENDFKDIEIVSEPLDIKSSLKAEVLPKIEKWQTISKHPSMQLKSKKYYNTNTQSRLERRLFLYFKSLMKVQ